MVLAQAEEFYVPDYHHLITLHFEQRSVQHPADVDAVAAGKESQRAVDPCWSRGQSCAMWIIGEWAQHRPNKSRQIRLRGRRHHFYSCAVRFHDCGWPAAPQFLHSPAYPRHYGGGIAGKCLHG